MTAAVSATTGTALWSTALRRAAAGASVHLDVVDRHGVPRGRLEPGRFLRPRPGDAGLLARCTGATIDLGCGPGRLAAALAAAGRRALGVDLNPVAVRLARRRGAPTRLACVFDPQPGEGSWRHALLADGNIGIGGDPVRLLRRCAGLIRPDGDVLVEVEPPGTGAWTGLLALRDGDRISHPFPWAFVDPEALATAARRVALTVTERWIEDQRWFVRLTHA